MHFLRRLLARARIKSGSGLNSVIPPEITDDTFTDAISRVGSTPGLRHILEIGSSAGEGSTEAFVRGARGNPHPPALHCIEVSQARYDALVRRYQADSFVHCYRVSSVPIEAFPSPAEIEHFYRTVDSRLHAFPLKHVLEWLQEDIEYISKSHVPATGIRDIKDEHGIVAFDVVLIDGSEFTGAAELKEVYGARFILLDDICTYKNFQNFRQLSSDPHYRVLESSDELRNGYAVFERAAS